MERKEDKVKDTQRLELEKLTEEMLEFVEKETEFKREELFKIEEDEELRQKILRAIFDIEVEEIGDDGKISKRGKIAADIVTIITYKPDHDDEEDEEE